MGKKQVGSRLGTELAGLGNLTVSELAASLVFR